MLDPRFVFSILWNTYITNHTQEDLAKFGYINWRRKKRHERRFGLNMTISTCFSTKHGNFWGFFSQKIICTSHIPFFSLLPSGKILPPKRNFFQLDPICSQIFQKVEIISNFLLVFTFNIVFIILGNMCFKIVRKASKTFNFFWNFVQMLKVAQHALDHFEQFCQHL